MGIIYGGDIIMEEKIKSYKELILQYDPVALGNKIKILKEEIGSFEWKNMLEEERVSLIIKEFKKGE
jgi:hypothetical protein